MTIAAAMPTAIQILGWDLESDASALLAASCSFGCAGTAEGFCVLFLEDDLCLLRAKVVPFNRVKGAGSSHPPLTAVNDRLCGLSEVTRLMRLSYLR